MADVENIIDAIPDDSKDLMRARVTNVITNFVHYSKPLQSSPMNKLFDKTQSFLKTNPDLLILQADKGGCTVAIRKAEYINKTLHLLHEKPTYTEIPKDPTTTIQILYNNLIKDLKNRGLLSEQEAKKLMIYNSVAPTMYCLPKIHKANVPIRAIVSFINSITYNLSKFLSDLLGLALGDTTNYNVKDTFSFVTAVSDFKLPNNFVVISLDVVSLFTNIPADLVIKILKLKWNIIQIHTKLSRDSFLALINFIFKNTYFSFNGKFYKQIFGTPMGSPISPILAQIVLDHLLDSVIPELPFQMPFLFKYVDDIICSVPTDQIQTTLNIFNSFNNKIQFTIEEETNQSVPFLDTKVIRTNNNEIMLDWYQKDTASGRFLNFYSNHPKNQKFNTVIAMKNRITHIGHPFFLNTNLKILFNILVNNGYPKKVLNKLIYNTNFYDGPTEDQPPGLLIYKKKFLCYQSDGYSD